MGAFWGDSKPSPTSRIRCGEADWNDSEGCQHSKNAQAELQAICSASQADRELAGVSQDFGDEEVSGNSRAVGAARGCIEEVLHFG